MMRPSPSLRIISSLLLAGAMICASTNSTHAQLAAAESAAVSDALSKSFNGQVLPLIDRYCAGCHSTDEKKGELDLERFTTLATVRKDLKPWQQIIEQLEAGEMPPKDKRQPTAAERKLLIDWTRNFLNSEARAHAGDPGRVALHRLSNAQYDRIIRDITGIDLRPTREFPADGAAGEGFTNASEALTMSPAMMSKYLDASKKIATHAVLLPDGFRFSPTATRRDWTDESLASLRAFYAQFTPADDGALPLDPYIKALVIHRASLQAGKVDIAAIAAQEKLNAKYLGILFAAFTYEQAAGAFPMQHLRKLWQSANPDDAGPLLAQINNYRNTIWEIVPVGSYRFGNTVRGVARKPTIVESQTLRFKLNATPGQTGVILHLASRDLFNEAGEGKVLWSQPRFEGNGQPPLLLRDYAKFGPRYEVDYTELFANTARYMAAAVEAANDPLLTMQKLSDKHEVDAGWLKRWIEVLDVKPLSGQPVEDAPPGRVVSPIKVTLLDEKTPQNNDRPAINGWKPKGQDLPVIVTNSSDKAEAVPGRMLPHRVCVHPTPTQFVAVEWNSPITGKVRLSAIIEHAHSACGNGVQWWVQCRQGDRIAIVGEGNIDLGKSAQLAPIDLKVTRGDQITLAIGARDNNHSCDLTDIAFTIEQLDAPANKWDLAADIAGSVLDGNPHADRLGNKDVWRFVQGASKDRAINGNSPSAGNSLLTRWRKAASDPAGKEDTAKLATQLQSLLAGARPADANSPDRALFDQWVTINGPLLQGIDHRSLAYYRSPGGDYGLPADRFVTKDEGTAKAGDLLAAAGETIQIRLPAALFQDREFIVDAKLADPAQTQVVHFQVLPSPPSPQSTWDIKSPIVTTPESPAHKRLLAGLDQFSELFPRFICYPHVIPLDEVVCLKTFHREDEPLKKLFLSEEQIKTIDTLWEEHRFISHFPVVENEYLPLFIGFVTQDGGQKMVDYFESQREPFRLRAERFNREFEAAAPKQLAQLHAFAARAWRRPLDVAERDSLSSLYQTMREKGQSHEEAFRDVLARVLISPSFLMHIENAPAGKEARPVNDWELASRLSFFLWSSVPDEELRKLAAEGKLHEPQVLTAQTQRMLKDDRIRALAIEFGTQWIHVRGFDTFNEKSESLFPTFNDELRSAIYQESILFFEDLFQNNRKVEEILNADHTFVNETLANHYGIPNIKGPQFRRIDSARQYGRGGILTLASVQSKQAGAARTSPVLRGNWVVETLLGEKLPRPPANVPQLPEAETGNDGLTMRQLVEKHVRAPECATCHQRIDPYGFALEKYDSIGRLRSKDLGGLAITTDVKLKDGTTFDGVDGLRDYLLTKKKDVFTRLFCQRLMGYALRRTTTLSDHVLIDEMVNRINKGDSNITDIVQAIVQSPQFRMIRGGDYSDE